jgi:catechol 2,3-dioxygenase-like lactoylglutathione lyase family enzyme
MAIIPVFRCSEIKRAVDFYTTVLDFRLADDDALEDPAFIFVGARETRSCYRVLAAGQSHDQSLS